MNESKQSTKRNSFPCRLRIGFCNTEKRQKAFGFLTKTGVLEMLEEADYKHAGLVSPFFVEILDFFCANARRVAVSNFLHYTSNLSTKLPKKRKTLGGWSKN